MANDEPWDKPSEKLKRLAANTETPQMRLCEPGCGHRHPKGRMCGAWTGTRAYRGWCKCEK